MGRRSHVKPILDIATILAERGYNVILLASGNNVLSSEYTILQKGKNFQTDLQKRKKKTESSHKKKSAGL
ncbi:unnamed protein product [Rhizophagus irregularis]|nr:unnamed protein product [Rhizophagus irregularis]